MIEPTFLAAELTVYERLKKTEEVLIITACSVLQSS